MSDITITKADVAAFNRGFNSALKRANEGEGMPADELAGLEKWITDRPEKYPEINRILADIAAGKAGE